MIETDSPFRPRGKVRQRPWWPVSMDEAMNAAHKAGFRAASGGPAGSVHVQRGLWTAATITPAPGGVVVKPAWTTAQVMAVGVFLVLLFIGICGQGIA